MMAQKKKRAGSCKEFEVMSKMEEGGDSVMKFKFVKFLLQAKLVHKGLA